MLTWTLILLVTVGALGRNGATVGVVPGFHDQEECQRAGRTTKLALGEHLIGVEYVCVVATSPAPRQS